MTYLPYHNSQKSDKSSTCHPALTTLSGFRPLPHQKTDKSSLTEKPTTISLESVPSHNTGHTFKQIIGGKVKNTQPPALSGFFMPATDSDDCNKLSGVARNKIPLCGNTCSASYDALEDTRQLNTCQNFKQFIEVNAMQSTQTHATGAPAPVDKGLTPTPSSTRCLIPASALLEAIVQAKQDKTTTGRGDAYAQLLAQFHAAILPAFITETRGNLSELARLLGIHRTTIKLYADQAGLTLNGALTVGGEA